MKIPLHAAGYLDRRALYSNFPIAVTNGHSTWDSELLTAYTDELPSVPSGAVRAAVGVRSAADSSITRGSTVAGDVAHSVLPVRHDQVLQKTEQAISAATTATAAAATSSYDGAGTIVVKDGSKHPTAAFSTDVETLCALVSLSGSLCTYLVNHKVSGPLVLPSLAEMCHSNTAQLPSTASNQQGKHEDKQKSSPSTKAPKIDSRITNLDLLPVEFLPFNLSSRILPLSHCSLSLQPVPRDTQSISKCAISEVGGIQSAISITSVIDSGVVGIAASDVTSANPVTVDTLVNSVGNALSSENISGSSSSPGTGVDSTKILPSTTPTPSEMPPLSLSHTQPKHTVINPGQHNTAGSTEWLFSCSALDLSSDESGGSIAPHRSISRVEDALCDNRRVTDRMICKY